MPTEKFKTLLDRNILLPVTCAFIAGIAAGFSPGAPIPAWPLVLLLVGCALAVLLLSLRSPFAALLLCVPLFFLIGYLNTARQIQVPFSGDHIGALVTTRQRASLVGTLASMVEYDGTRSRIVLDVQEIQIPGKHTERRPVRGKIRLTLRGRADELQPGQTLVILASIGPVTGFQTPGVFDYKTYLAARGIQVSGWIGDRREILQVRDLSRGPLERLRYLPQRLRQKIGSFLDQHLDRDIAGIYRALLIGSRNGVDNRVLEQFKATGTMHLLAISGLHMGLLGLMLGGLFSLLFRRSQWLLLHTHVPTLSLLATLPVLLGYAFIAGMNTPVLRALVMAAIVLWALLLRREHSMLHLVAAAALFVLALNPLALFTASFQLSFSAVTAMAVFLPRIMESGRFQGEGRTWTQLLLDALRSAFFISIIASLGTLPFMLLHFHRFSTIGPLMNLLIEPLLCFWALPLGLAAIPFIFLAPDLAAGLLHVGGYAIEAGLLLTRWAAALPFAALWTITPQWLEIIAYTLLLILWSCRFPPRLYRPLVAAGFVLLVLHFTHGLWSPDRPGPGRVSYLDVGQGTSTFLHLPDGSAVLIDGGGNRGSSINIGEQVIGPFLWKQRIWRLDTAMITHPHSDHFNGMDFILKHFQPRTLVINGDPRVEGKYSEILEQARRRGIEIVTGREGLIIGQGKDFAIKILGMNGLPVAENAPVNDRSLVLKYRVGKLAFLFPADISTRSEAVLLGAKTDLKADVLLAAHHGSATSNSRAFITSVAPETIVVSAGRSGRRIYPAPHNLALWQQLGIRTLITRDQGTITCTSDGLDLDCSTFAARNKQPWGRLNPPVKSR